MRKLCGTLLAAVLISGPVGGQDPSVRAFLDRTSVAVGQQFTLSVEVSGKGATGAGEPRLPPMEEFAAYLDTGSGYDEFAGGIGVKMASGVTVSLAGGARGSGDDASFAQSTVGYVFGNNSVGASYYTSSDVTATRDPMGTPADPTDDVSYLGDGQAIGIAFRHTMPKAKVDIIASLQQLSSSGEEGNLDETVAIIGTRVMF